jgi:hypothetical protein
VEGWVGGSRRAQEVPRGEGHRQGGWKCQEGVGDNVTGFQGGSLYFHCHMRGGRRGGAACRRGGDFGGEMGGARGTEGVGGTGYEPGLG